MTDTAEELRARANDLYMQSAASATESDRLMARSELADELIGAEAQVGTVTAELAQAERALQAATDELAPLQTDLAANHGTLADATLSKSDLRKLPREERLAARLRVAAIREDVDDLEPRVREAQAAAVAANATLADLNRRLEEQCRYKVRVEMAFEDPPLGDLSLLSEFAPRTAGLRASRLGLLELAYGGDDSSPGHLSYLRKHVLPTLGRAGLYRHIRHEAFDEVGRWPARERAETLLFKPSAEQMRDMAEARNLPGHPSMQSPYAGTGMAGPQRIAAAPGGRDGTGLPRTDQNTVIPQPSNLPDIGPTAEQLLANPEQ